MLTVKWIKSNLTGFPIGNALIRWYLLMNKTWNPLDDEWKAELTTLTTDGLVSLNSFL